MVFCVDTYVFCSPILSCYFCIFLLQSSSTLSSSFSAASRFACKVLFSDSNLLFLLDKFIVPDDLRLANLIDECLLVVNLPVFSGDLSSRRGFSLIVFAYTLSRTFTASDRKDKKALGSSLGRLLN